MSIKLSNHEADFFIKLYAGIGRINLLKSRYERYQIDARYSSDEIEEIMADEEDELAEAQQLLDKMKRFEEPQSYRIDPWGFEQTNFNNVKAIGTYRSSVVLIGDNKVFMVPKRKFNAKEKYTRLDDVRTTSWKEPFTSDEMTEQSLKNAYNGY